MARVLRIEYPGALYHVYGRGIARQKIFPNPADFALFLHALAQATDRHHLLIHAYCLMTNHYHLLLETPEEEWGHEEEWGQVLGYKVIRDIILPWHEC